MIAYKGFNRDLRSVMGDGQQATCQFTPGETKTVEKSRTGGCGFHCTENPFECLAYYPLDGENRFFVVDAEGDIDEDGCERIACTKITLLEEMDPYRMALEGMCYMVRHPDRAKWEQNRGGVTVAREMARADKSGHIAIARGKSPRVMGPEGSVLGILVEGGGGFLGAKLFKASPEQAGHWITLEDSTLKEVRE